MGKVKAVKLEVAKVDERLAKLDPIDDKDKYESLLHIRKLLQEQPDKGILERVDPNMVLKVLATFGVAGAIMLFESYGHIFTSKASAFMPRIM